MNIYLYGVVNLIISCCGEVVKHTSGVFRKAFPSSDSPVMSMFNMANKGYHDVTAVTGESGELT